MYKALKGRLIVEIIPNSNETDSGLFIVDGSFPLKAKVLSVGGECEGIKPPCNDGDIVYFKKYGAISTEGRTGKPSQEKGISCIYFKDIVAKERMK